ncbi:DUF29 family protein [Roseiarcus fermentans]|nr:DUF29 family protein [Roseiarcus fermentans]
MAQPAKRGPSWRLSIANARDEIADILADILADNPSLKSVLDEVTASAYRYARRKAAVETEMREEAFPARSRGLLRRRWTRRSGLSRTVSVL